MILPPYLYRGDQDPQNTRKLKDTLGSGLLLTNLCNGGIGKEIFNQPLKKSITKHVSTGWGKTHFLSFSENKEVALHYGSQDKLFDETYELKEYWDFALLTLQTNRISQHSLKSIDNGVYSAEFPPTCKEFLPSFRMIIINVEAHLKSINDSDSCFMDAINKAKRDKEWLILPTFPFSNGEFSSKLDENCISETQLFKFE
jgi:hypothetical protein